MILVQPSYSFLAPLIVGVRGYFAGGFDTVYLADIDGIQFDTEAATLSVARHSSAGVQSS